MTQPRANMGKVYEKLADAAMKGLTGAKERVSSKYKGKLAEVQDEVKKDLVEDKDKATQWILSASFNIWPSDSLKTELASMSFEDIKKIQGTTDEDRRYLKKYIKTREKLQTDHIEMEKGDFDKDAKKLTAGAAEKLAKNPDKAKEVQVKMDKFMEGLPGGKSIWKTAMATLVGWFGKDSLLGKFLAKLFGISKKKKKPESPSAPAGQPAQTPEQKEAEKKAAERQKKYVDLFKAKGLNLRTPEIEKDLKTLEKQGIKEADISALLDTAMKSGGNLEQILTAVNESLHNKKTPLLSFELRLADLLYQQKEMTPEKLKRVVTAITDKDSKVPKNLKDIRTFLDETNTDFEVAMKKYEKPKTATV